MTRLCQGTVLAVLVTSLSAAAPQPEPMKPDAKPGEVVAVFNDGTTIRKAVLQDNIEITTKYGKLSVPVADVRRIEFGLHVSDEAGKKVEGLVKQLGSDEFQQREAASKELVGLGVPALPALEAAVKSPDKEVSTRAKAALERIRETATDEQLKARPDDVIRTRDGGVLIGRIANESFKAQTGNFGDLSFKVTNLRSIQSAARSAADLSIEAAQFFTDSDKWFDTGLTVESGLDLLVSASGEVQLVPTKPGDAVAGPEGHKEKANSGYGYGTLLGRIGDKGEPFVIGKRYEAKSGQEGRLYLYVVPVDSEAREKTGPPTGSYKVKITSGYDLVPEKKRPAPEGGGPRATSLYNGAGATTGALIGNSRLPDPSPPSSLPPIAPAGGAR